MDCREKTSKGDLNKLYLGFNKIITLYLYGFKQQYIGLNEEVKES